MTSIPYSELKKGDQIILNNQPHEIVEASSMFKARGHSVLQTKLKNLITGEVISKTFHPSDSFEEAEITKITAKFIYVHRDKFIFSKLLFLITLRPLCESETRIKKKIFNNFVIKILPNRFVIDIDPSSSPP